MEIFPDTAECSNAQFHNAANSFLLSHGSGGWVGILSPTISGTSATESLSVGFWVRVTSTSYYGTWIGGVGGIQECVIGFDDRPKTRLTSFGGTWRVWNETLGLSEDTGVAVVVNTWLHMEWIIDETANTYTTRLDDVNISTGDGIGFGSIALTRFKVCTNGPASSYTDEVVVGAPVITSTAVTTGACGVAYSYQAISDATEDETWTLTVAPSYLSIGASTGLITGTPTAAGVDSVTVQVETSAGTDTQSYTIAVTTSCGGGGGGHTIVTGGGGAVQGGSFIWRYDEYPEELPEENICDASSLTITFQDTTADRELVLTYIWDFGDGSGIVQSTNPIAIHTYPEFGKYTVTSALMLSDGTIYRQSQEVTLGECAFFLSDVAQDLTAAIISSAVVLWLVFVFTRRRPILMLALILTLVGAAAWALLLAAGVL